MLTTQDFNQLRVIIREEVRDIVRDVVRDVVREEVDTILQRDIIPRISAIERDVEQIKSDVVTIKQDILILNHRFSTLEHKITGIELQLFKADRRMTGIERDVVIVINMFGEKFDTVSSRLVIIENKLGIRVD